jgi:hypothetical protein
MRTRFARLIVISSALGISSWAQQPAAAPAPAGAAAPARRGRGPVAPTGPLPRLADGKPDLNGVWNGSTGDISRSLKPGEQIILTPAAEKIFKARLSKDDPEAACLPGGVPRMAPYPWRIVQQATHIFLLYEANTHSYRQIFTDGRQHHNLWDTWYGDSIGTWEGDTLVVDTIGFNDRFWFDAVGHPHTTQLHTIERWTRRDYGTLVIETTIIDPGAYVKPFTISMTAVLGPKDDLMEYICAENNQDLSHIQNEPASR